MWIGVEIWDSEAKRVIETYTKGSRIAGMAILMHNKWKDKVTGEDKKQFKLRMTKVMKEEEVNDFLGDIIEEEPSSGITDNYDYGANNEQQQAYDTPQQTYDTRQQQQQQQTRRPAAPARMVPPRYSPRNTGGNSEIPF
jgi:single-stranded DNA-binding protein